MEYDSKLKEIKRQSLDLYKEQSPNLYAIPQISKQDIERIEGLGISLKSTVRNFVSDLCLDRVDDSLYGKTRQGEVYDRKIGFGPYLNTTYMN